MPAKAAQGNRRGVLTALLDRADNGHAGWHQESVNVPFASHQRIPRVIVRQASLHQAEMWRLQHPGGFCTDGTLLWANDALCQDEIRGNTIADTVMAVQAEDPTATGAQHVVVVGDSDVATALYHRIADARWQAYEQISAQVHPNNGTYDSYQQLRAHDIAWLTNPRDAEPITSLSPRLAKPESRAAELFNQVVVPCVASVHPVGPDALHTARAWQASRPHRCGSLQAHMVPSDLAEQHIDLTAGVRSVLQRPDELRKPHRQSGEFYSPAVAVRDHLERLLAGRVHPRSYSDSQPAAIRPGDRIAVIFVDDAPWAHDMAHELAATTADTVRVHLVNQHATGSVVPDSPSLAAQHGTGWLVNGAAPADSWAWLAQAQHGRIRQHNLQHARLGSPGTTTGQLPVGLAGCVSIVQNMFAQESQEPRSDYLTRYPWPEQGKSAGVPVFFTEDYLAEVRQLVHTLALAGHQLNPAGSATAGSKPLTKDHYDVVARQVAPVEMDRWQRRMLLNGWLPAMKRHDPRREHPVLATTQTTQSAHMAWVELECMIHLERLAARGYQLRTTTDT